MNGLPSSKKNGRKKPKPSSPTAMARSRCWRSTSGISARLAGLLPEQALRLEDHDQHQVREYDRGGPLAADPVVRDLLDAADDHAAQHGALKAPDPSHDRCRERDQARGEALE